MNTLSDIINAVRDGEKPDYEELRYAICAMSALSVFNRKALMNLAEAEREGKKPFLSYSAVHQWEEHYRREQTALGKSPKEYVGWNNDPENPEFLSRRNSSKKIYAHFVQSANSGRN